MTLEKQRGPQIPDLGYRLTVQHPFPRPEFLSRLSFSRLREIPDIPEMGLSKSLESICAQSCPGCANVNLSYVYYVGHNRHVVRPDYDMMLPEDGEKIHQSQEDSPEFQAIYVPREELSCPFPARRSAFEDRSPARH